MSLPQSLGVSGGYLIFSIGGLFYKTNAVTQITSEIQARALIAAGTAIQQFESYQAQFPWLYESNAWVTESGSGGANGTNVVTETGEEIWA